MYEPDNQNIEDTGKLMTQSVASRTRRKIILIVAAFVAVALIAALGVRLVGDKKYNDQVAVAEKALAEGNYEQAETQYLAAKDMNKRKPKAREGLAYVYALLGRYEDAGNEYRSLYKQFGKEEYKSAADDTDKGYLPVNHTLVPVRFWRNADLERTPYSMELVRFLTGVNNDFITEGRSFSYDDQNSSGGADLLQSIMEGKYEPVYIIPAGTEKAASDGQLLKEYTEWIDWTYEGKDPKGWRDDQHLDMTRFKAETVDWILTEIFNVPDDTIKAWQEKGEKDHKFYLADDGYYYSFCWIDVDEGGAVDLVSLKTDGVNFCVEYNAGNYGEMSDAEYDTLVSRYDTDGFIDWPVDTSNGDYAKCYAMLELKNIDGRQYWSMHYNGTELPPELRDAGQKEEKKPDSPQVVTEVTGTMEDELIDFLSYLPYYSYGGMGGPADESKGLDYYNNEEAADCRILFGLMWNAPCINYDTYPLDFDRTEMWETGETDPLGRAVFEDGGSMMCYRTNADAVNWVAKNIFNVSDEQIDKELSISEKKTQNPDEKMGNFYLHDGKYYLITGGIGWETSYDFKINDIHAEGDFLIVTYTEYDYLMGEEDTPDVLEFRAKMQYKIIDGKGYWSLYTRELL